MFDFFRLPGLFKFSIKWVFMVCFVYIIELDFYAVNFKTQLIFDTWQNRNIYYWKYFSQFYSNVVGTEVSEYEWQGIVNKNHRISGVIEVRNRKLHKLLQKSSQEIFASSQNTNICRTKYYTWRKHNSNMSTHNSKQM